MDSNCEPRHHDHIPTAATLMNRIYIIGAGALGGLIGGRLALRGHDVTFIDRGDHLEAMQRQGLRLIAPDGVQKHIENGRYAHLSEPLPQPALIFLATKAHEIPPIAARVAELLGSDTVVVTVQNGLPWWYFQGLPGLNSEQCLHSLDPDGRVRRYIPAEHLIGGVAYPAAEVTCPGVVRHVEGDRFALGELDGAITSRLESVAELLESCGLRTHVLEDIRSEIWLKAWGAMGLNPVSALTGETMAAICRTPETRELLIDIMCEGERVATALGVKLRVSLERRLAGAERVGEHKTSMLQDLEAGRPMEIDALVGSILELGRHLQIPMPITSVMYALLKARNRVLIANSAVN